MIFIGIDNGVSGSIAFIREDKKKRGVHPVPVKNCLDYTKAVRYVTRVDHDSLFTLIETTIRDYNNATYVNIDDVRICIERPMINPMRFRASMGAIRCLENVLIIVEELRLSYSFIDSKEWQRAMLPAGTSKRDDLKKISTEIAERKFPGGCFRKNKIDGDAYLMTEYMIKKYLRGDL